jgi:hypothetical protein
MRNITLTPTDYKNFYLYRYYHDQRLIIKLMRIIGGPLLIFAGINYYFSEAHNLAISILFIAYGIYYIIRPFIDIMIKKPSVENFSFNLENNHLIIQNEQSFNKLNLFDYPLKMNEKYFYLHGENKHVIFFPKAKLDNEAQEKFEKKAEELKA